MDKLTLNKESSIHYADRFDQNFYEFSTLLAQCSRKGEVLADENKLLSHCGMSIAFFNNCFIDNQECIEEVVPEEAHAFFNQGSFDWQCVFPERLDPVYRDHLTQHGLKLESSIPAMVFDGKVSPLIEPEIYSELEIKAVDDLATHEDFKAIAAPAFGILDFVADRIITTEFTLNKACTLYIGYLDSQPVSTSMIYVSHGIAGVYWVTTTEDQRGKGLGEALTYHATKEGLGLVERFVSLQASEMGAPVYERMGYKTPYHYKKYVFHAESANAS